MSDQPHTLEVRILARLAAGHSYGEIGTAEYLSGRTVRRLVRELKRRTGVSSLAGLCAEATRRGWLPERHQLHEVTAARRRPGRHADVSRSAAGHG